MEQRDLVMGQEASAMHGEPGAIQLCIRDVWWLVSPSTAQNEHSGTHQAPDVPAPTSHSRCRHILTSPWVSPGTNPTATHTLQTREHPGCPCPQRLRSGPLAPNQEAEAGAADEKPCGEEGAWK